MKLKGISEKGIRKLAQLIDAQEEELLMEEPMMEEEPLMESDMPDAEDLVMYIDNTYELYGQKQAIQKNLINKIKRGKYDPSLAPKLWMYLVQEGAKRWAQELEGYNMPWHKLFPPQLRQEAAQMMASAFDEEISFAGDEDLNQYFGV